MPAEDYAKIEDSLYVDLKDCPIHNDADIASFLSTELQIRDTLDTPQWRLIYKENYQEDKSLLIMKIHHTVADGYGVLAFTASVADNPEEINFGHLKKFQWWEKLMIYLTLPYHFIMITLSFVILQKKNRNPLAVDTRSSGIKRGHFAKEFSVSKIKEKCKEYNVTFNDFIMTVVSLTIKEYFISKGDERTDRILMMMPWSFREPPT